MLTRDDVLKIRGGLMLQGYTNKRVAQELGISETTVSQVISGECTSQRVRAFIAERIGHWPWPEPRRAPRTPRADAAPAGPVA